MFRSRNLADYRLEVSIDETGKERREAVYIGPLYRWAAPEEVLRRTAARFGAGAVLAWLLFFASLWEPSGLTRLWYVAVPYCCLVFPLFLVSASVYRLARVSCPFERAQKEKMADRLKSGALAGLLLSGAVFLGELAGWLSGRLPRRGSYSEGELLPGGGLLSRGSPHPGADVFLTAVTAGLFLFFWFCLRGGGVKPVEAESGNPADQEITADQGNPADPQP
ncbi:MAG: hypothetical protein LBQ15_07950 [Clostridium sp.]|jgi:hypothetical protein|nr:hypothetical protein [Clostridium sp.]